MIHTMSKGGRPLLGEQRRERYQIVLEPRIAEEIKGMGRGSLTAGINEMYALISKQGVQARKTKRGKK